MLKWKRKRTSIKVPITLLFALIVSMGIGYAVINSSLKIGGATTISKNSWDIHFENLTTVNGTYSDDETISIESNKTAINFKVTLETIDDYYQIDVDVVNSGGIDAMLKSITTSGLTDTQKQYLDFYVTYNNGNQIKDKEGSSLASQKSKIGLMYLSDYYFAYQDGSGKTNCSSVCNSWLMLSISEWTMTRYGYSSYYRAWYVSSDGSTTNNTVDFALGIRPVFYINGNNIGMTGKGTLGDPFIIN